MKCLIVFYSRSGITKKVAKYLAKRLKADIEEVNTVASRAGIIGYLGSGREATMKKLAEIKPTKKDPSKYDVVVVGTPVWAWNVSSPIRSYLSKNKAKFRKIAFFCTMGGSGGSQALISMCDIVGKTPLATAELRQGEVMKGDSAGILGPFIEKLAKAL